MRRAESQAAAFGNMTHWPEPGRVHVEVQTTSGRAAAVEVRIWLDTVEVWHQGRCCGVVGRNLLREWLNDSRVGRSPAGMAPLVVDEVVVSLDLLMDREAGRVAITLPDVREWSLSPAEEANLRAQVSAG